MKLRDLLVGVPLTGGRFDPELEINSIQTEAQDSLQGALFVELPDSPISAREALERGAAAAVSPVHTEDIWRTLARLSVNWYCHPGSGMTLTAVAGGAGSEIVAHLLQGVLENTPRVRAGVITGCGVWIDGVELPAGQRTPGGGCVQRLLRRMADARCTHVVIHLDEGALRRREYEGLHMSVTALTAPCGPEDAMAELLAQSDMAVLSLDERDWEDYVSIIPEHAFTYSENKGCADLMARNLRLFPGHMEFEAVAVGHIQRIHLPVPGGFTVYHGLCVLACGLCLGLKWERMARVLRCAQGLPGHMEVLPVPAAYTVVLDGADTPRSLEQLLTGTREFTAGRLICVLNCPVQKDGALRMRLGGVAEQLADRLILTGDRSSRADTMQAIGDVLSGTGGWHRPCTIEPDRSRAICSVLDEADPGDVIVFAGWQEDSIREEREAVQSYFRQHACRKVELLRSP